LGSNIEKSNLNIIISGYGCCRSEILATRGPLYDIQRFGINFVNMAEDADILVVSGFSSEKGIHNAIDIYKRMRAPRWVFACGSCAISGGRFCGTPQLREEIERDIKVDMYIPGCPPRPEAFIYAILRFISENNDNIPAKVKDV